MVTSSARRESFSISVISRAQWSGCAPWKSTFTDQRKDYRYYEILDDTLRGHFEHRYFAIVDSRGHTRAIQPFFLVDQDILEGLGAERVAEQNIGPTARPTADWIANQITAACGLEQAPRHLIRDRDGAYGEVFIRRLRSMGIRDRPTSPRSPRQNGYAERLIGSIRRECLDHVVVFSDTSVTYWRRT
jgi:hypothetical protein